MSPANAIQARLDSFAYRHRVAEVMSKPLLTGPIGLTLSGVCERMHRSRISSMVVVDDAGRPLGMITERDLVDALAKHRGEALDLLVGQVMNSPVITIPEEAFIYAAIGRMSRLGIRHLVAVDRNGRASGMITGRALLTLRSQEAAIIGDGIATAETAADLKRHKESLPRLVRALLDEDVAVHQIAAIISGVIREITARTAELALLDMKDHGWGEPPAPWCLLILGSAGRDETLLGGDQDNAIIHRGTSADDPWFAELGRRVNDMLEQAGIPKCEGGVMCGNPQWRRNIEDWKAEIDRWVEAHEPSGILNVDIFYDFQPVIGDVSLAEELRAHALQSASESPLFLQLIAHELRETAIPLGVLGGFVMVDDRLNVKMFGLLPVVGMARVLAIRHRLPATSTTERLRLLTAGKHIDESDALDFIEHHRLFLSLILEQQLADIADGMKPGARIIPDKLKKSVAKRLKTSLKAIEIAKMMASRI